MTRPPNIFSAVSGFQNIAWKHSTFRNHLPIEEKHFQKLLTNLTSRGPSSPFLMQFYIFPVMERLGNLSWIDMVESTNLLAQNIMESYRIMNMKSCLSQNRDLVYLPHCFALLFITVCNFSFCFTCFFCSLIFSVKWLCVNSGVQFADHSSLQPPFKMSPPGGKDCHCQPSGISFLPSVYSVSFFL